MASTARIVQLNFADRSFPASMVDVPRRNLPGSEWVRIEVAAGGICGSDLHLFNGATGPAQALSGYAALPMDLGHEVAGHVVQAGARSGIAEGTAVAIDPVIACVARGIKPRCAHCAAGRASTCHNFGSRVTTPGMGIGFTSGLGGGWGDEVLAHGSMVHVLPPSLPVDVAPLHEPLSIAIHGLMRQPPANGDPVLVVGAGIIGLCAVAAVGSLFPASPITILAKHAHQGDAARAIGATNVVMRHDDGRHLDELADIAGTVVRGRADGRMLAGGFPYVVEAVGTAAAVTETLRLADGRATVLVLGAAGLTTVDLTPVWFKELAVVGSFCHAADGDEHSIDRALELLAAGALPADVVITHTFPLEAYRDAIAVAMDKSSGAIKVMLIP
ncbi:MAG TPA: zinc-binding dehydrogenase [Acidimicrobiales bacterium]|nr:zinc-binding dehydrogenase [Acidimicrobiales bacterium]